MTTPDGVVQINPTGGPVLATAGSGDVLTGIIGGLLARGMTPVDAASAGAYVHGLAGIAAGRLGEGTLASDVARHVPEAVDRVMGGRVSRLRPTCGRGGPGRRPSQRANDEARRGGTDGGGEGRRVRNSDVEVARAALEAGATWIGVALIEEGLRLRDAGIDARILVLSEFPPGVRTEALGSGLTPASTRTERSGVWRRRPGVVDVGVHVKIDTGMHRAGVYPPDATPAFVERLIAAGFAWRPYGPISPVPPRTRRPRCCSWNASSPRSTMAVPRGSTDPPALGEQRRHDPVSGDPSRPGSNGDRDLRAGAGAGCRRRPGSSVRPSRGAPRSSGQFAPARGGTRLVWTPLPPGSRREHGDRAGGLRRRLPSPPVVSGRHHHRGANGAGWRGA